MKRKRLWVSIDLVVIIVASALLYFHLHAKKTDMDKKGSDALSSSFSGQKPSFAIYYPKNLPKGITVDKGSLKSDKDILSFNINLDGKQVFFVSEQPTEQKFNTDAFKSKLKTPSDITTELGPGIIGTLNSGLVTAVDTKDKTLIIVNCVNPGGPCITNSKTIIDSMKPVQSLSDL